MTITYVNLFMQYKVSAYAPLRGEGGPVRPLSMLEAAVGCGARMAERHARFGKPLLFPPRPERFPLSPQRGEGRGEG